MNAGLANLTTLKSYLLAAALRSATDYDAALTAIGLGVAGQMEKYCNRKFARVVGDTYICSADRDHAYVPRLPLEAFTKIELKADLNVGWELQSTLVLNTNPDSGLVYWGAGISFQWAQMRITYTGGFWWDTTEDNTGTLPSGATVLPDNLRLAWLEQCAEVWKHKDKLGQGITDEKNNPAIAENFLPFVKTALEQYRRYSLL